MAGILRGAILALAVFLLGGGQGVVGVGLAVALGFVFGAFMYTAATRRPPTYWEAGWRWIAGQRERRAKP